MLEPIEVDISQGASSYNRSSADQIRGYERIIEPGDQCDCGKGAYCPQYGSKFIQAADAAIESYWLDLGGES